MNTSATAQRDEPAEPDESASRLGLRAGLSSAAIVAVLLAIAVWQSGIISLNASSSAVIDPQDTSGASGAEKAGFITPPAHPDDQEVAWEVSANVLQNDYDREGLATAHGPALLVDANARPAESQDSSSDSVDLSTPGSSHRQSTAVVLLDPETGTVRWYRLLSSEAAYSYARFADPSKQKDRFAARSFLASPDGEYIVVRLVPRSIEESARRGDDVIDQSRTLVVLSAETGEVVRTVETDERVLGQALTNDALVVETSPTFHPDGGTMTSYSLTDPKADPFSWPATGWLVGATANSAVTSPRKYSDYSSHCVPSTCSPATLSLSDPGTGETRSTIDHVYRVYPNGWVERYTDYTDRADAAGDPDASGKAQEGEAPRELLDLETGARLSVTGMIVTRRTAPTGDVWVLRTPDANESDDTSTPTSWLPASSEKGQALTTSTEPVDLITVSGFYRHNPSWIRRITLTMGAS